MSGGWEEEVAKWHEMRLRERFLLILILNSNILKASSSLSVLTIFLIAQMSQFLHAVTILEFHKL